MKVFCKSVRLKIFERINKYILESQRNELLVSLDRYGEDFYFQMPIYISGSKQIEIGDNVSIAAFVHIWGEGGVKIGSKVMIASHTAITSLTHDYSKSEMFRTLVKKPVVIHDNVWIGAHSVILPGVSIGEGAVVGAGSVVTEDVEPYSIVFGCPARHYKFRFLQNG